MFTEKKIKLDIRIVYAYCNGDLIIHSVMHKKGILTETNITLPQH